MNDMPLASRNEAYAPDSQAERFLSDESSNSAGEEPLQTHPTVILLDKDPQRKSTLKDRLESTSSHIIIFEQVTPCQTYIEDNSHDQIILIVENEIGSIIVPEIDDLPCLVIVFVYSLALNPRKQWIQQYKTKVKDDIFLDFNALETAVRQFIAPFTTPPAENESKTDNVSPPSHVHPAWNTHHDISALRLLWISPDVDCDTDTYRTLLNIDPTLLFYASTETFVQRCQRFDDQHFLLIVENKSAERIVLAIHDIAQISSIYVYVATDETDLQWTTGYDKICKTFSDLSTLIEHTKPFFAGKTAAVSSKTFDKPNIIGTDVDNNAECCLIWLDAEADQDIYTQEQLRDIGIQFKLFINLETCEKYISDRPNGRFFVVVSYDLGSVIAPRIALLPQTIVVFVYARQAIRGAQWPDQCLSKVEPTVCDMQTLKNSILYELHKQGFSLTTDTDWMNDATISILHRDEMTHKNLKLENGNVLWFKLFVEVLIRMKDNQLAHMELVQALRNTYSSSASELDFIEKFSDYYSADDAIYWYTCESCLYNTLNKALRQQNLDQLFLFRHFIKDIYQQLEKANNDVKAMGKNDVVVLYRGQTISKKELQQLQTSEGQYIAMNSLLSTTEDKDTAIEFLRRPCKVGLKRILFEITADYNTNSNPFADIGKLSELGTNNEALFMLGCVFRIQAITEIKEQGYHLLQLELCSKDDDSLTSVLEYLKKSIMQEETDLITLGSLLRKMGAFDKARKYFELLLGELEEQMDESGQAHCYYGLGNIADDMEDYALALLHHTTALELRKMQDPSPENQLLVAVSLISVANDQKNLKYYDEASDNMQEALLIISNPNITDDERQLTEIACRNTIGSIKFKQGQYAEALDEFTKILEQQELPDDHPDLALTCQNVALCYLSQENYEHALLYSQKALVIRVKTLPDIHPGTARTYRTIGLAHEGLDNYPLALDNLLKANKIYKAIQSNNTELKDASDDIQRIQERLNGKLHTKISIRATRFQETVPSEEAADIRRVILLGRSGTGKSSFGNSLLGYKFFEAKCSSESVTRSCRMACRQISQMILMVIDTPGLIDTNKSLEEIRTEIARSLEMTEPGPHAFLLVLESDRFTDQEKNIPDLLQSIFGTGAIEHTILVFTGFNKLLAKGTSVDEFINGTDASLTQLVAQCKKRYVIINNQDSSEEIDRTRSELLEIMEEMLEANGGTFSSKSLYETKH